MGSRKSKRKKIGGDASRTARKRRPSPRRRRYSETLKRDFGPDVVPPDEDGGMFAADDETGETQESDGRA